MVEWRKQYQAAREQYDTACHALNADDKCLVKCADGVARKLGLIQVNICIDKTVRKTYQSQSLYPVDIFLGNYSNKARHAQGATRTVAMLGGPTSATAPAKIGSKERRTKSNKTVMYEGHLYLQNAMRLILTPIMRMQYTGALLRCPHHWTMPDGEEDMLVAIVVACHLVDNQEADDHCLVYRGHHSDRTFTCLPSDKYLSPNALHDNPMRTEASTHARERVLCIE